MPAGPLAHYLQEYGDPIAVLDRDQITCYNNPMSNTKSLAETILQSDAWVWVDDMITFCEWDDENDIVLENDGSAERILAELTEEGVFDPICCEFPQD